MSFKVIIIKINKFITHYNYYVILDYITVYAQFTQVLQFLFCQTREKQPIKYNKRGTKQSRYSKKRAIFCVLVFSLHLMAFIIEDQRKGKYELNLKCLRS